MPRSRRPLVFPSLCFFFPLLSNGGTALGAARCTPLSPLLHTQRCRAQRSSHTRLLLPSSISAATHRQQVHCTTTVCTVPVSRLRRRLSFSQSSRRRSRHGAAMRSPHTAAAMDTVAGDRRHRISRCARRHMSAVRHSGGELNRHSGRRVGERRRRPVRPRAPLQHAAQQQRFRRHQQSW